MEAPASAYDPLLAKTRAPQTTSCIIERPRLSALLLETSTHHRITALHGPAGAGKSTLLAQTFKPGQPSPRHDGPVLWIRLDSLDSAADFWSLLSIALRESGLQRTCRVDAEATADITPWGACMDSSATIIIDDFHVLEPADGSDILSKLPTLFPRVHLIISTRLPLPEHSPHIQITTIGSGQLLFNRQETAQLADMTQGLPKHGGKPSEKAHDFIFETSGGWPALVSLLLGQRVDPASQNIPESVLALVGEYCDKELFPELSDEAIGFIYGASLLPYLEENICTATLGARDYASLIEELDTHSPFLSLPNSEKRRTVLPLCRTTFRCNMEKNRVEEAAAILERTEAWFVKRGDHPHALQYAFERRDYAHMALHASRILCIESSLPASVADLTRLASLYRLLDNGLEDVSFLADDGEMSIGSAPAGRYIELLNAVCRNHSMDDDVMAVAPAPRDEQTTKVDRSAEGRPQLSKKERAILAALVNGKDVKMIAAETFTSELTVRTHLKSVYRKLDVHGKDEAIYKAISLDIL